MYFSSNDISELGQVETGGRGGFLIRVLIREISNSSAEQNGKRRLPAHENANKSRCEATSVGVGRLRRERSGRRPAGHNVGVVQRVELCPEDVALGAQGVVGRVLFGAGAGVLDDPG